MLIALIIIVGLSILILGHEAGHFVVAKLFKLKIDEFGVGFPPRMFGARRYRGRERVAVAVEREAVTVIEQGEVTGTVEETMEVEREIDVVRPVKKWRFFWGKEPAEDVTPRQARGDTVYSVNWLPFGGFVKIAGENDAMPGDSDSTMLSHSSAGSAVKAQSAMRSHSGGGTGASAVTRHSGIEGHDAENVVSEVDRQRLFSFQPPWKRALVTAAGVVINFLIGWLLLSVVFMIGTTPALVITDVQSSSPAAQAGIHAGDVIVGYTTAQSFIDFTNAHRGQPVTVEIKRGKEKIPFAMTPRIKTTEGEGALGVLLAEAGVERQGFFMAFVEGFKASLAACWLVLTTFAVLIRQPVLNRTLLEGIVGPIGIFAVAQETGRIGILYLVNLISLISLNLAVLNLIPFPALDGGRLLLIAIEKVKGSPLSKRTEQWVNGVGFAFLILLMVLVSVRDVARLL
jgi:regulator of sigma E protease